MSLTSEQIQDLLSKPEAGRYAIPHIQTGPLRWFDKEMRCTNRGCGSATYCKVENVPRCMKHALETLNLLIQEREHGTS